VVAQAVVAQAVAAQAVVVARPHPVEEVLDPRSCRLVCWGCQLPLRGRHRHQVVAARYPLAQWEYRHRNRDVSDICAANTTSCG